MLLLLLAGGVQAQTRFGSLDELLTIDARKAKVGDEDVECEVVEALQRPFARLGLRHLKPLFLKAFGDHTTERRLVVHE